MTSPSTPSRKDLTELLGGPFDGQYLEHLGGARAWVLVDPRTGESIAAVGERALGCGLAEMQRTYLGVAALRQVQGVYRTLPGAPPTACFIDLAGACYSGRARRHRALASFTFAWYQVSVLRGRDLIVPPSLIEQLLAWFPDDPVVAVMRSEYIARLELLEE